MKCIVYGCTNHTSEGMFVGDICSPCYTALTRGEECAEYGTGWIFDIRKLRQEVEALKPVNAVQYNGQFFVEDVSDSGDGPVPVDNFVFYTFDEKRNFDGFEVRLSAMGGSILVSHGTPENCTYDWYDTYAQGLRRMANLLESNMPDATDKKHPDSWQR